MRGLLVVKLESCNKANGLRFKAMKGVNLNRFSTLDYLLTAKNVVNQETKREHRTPKKHIDKHAA
jgi:hypothetical protein